MRSSWNNSDLWVKWVFSNGRFFCSINQTITWLRGHGTRVMYREIAWHLNGSVSRRLGVGWGTLVMQPDSVGLPSCPPTPSPNQSAAFLSREKERKREEVAGRVSYLCPVAFHDLLLRQRAVLLTPPNQNQRNFCHTSTFRPEPIKFN